MRKTPSFNYDYYDKKLRKLSNQGQPPTKRKNMKFKIIFSLLAITFVNSAFVNPTKSLADKPEITNQSFIEFLSLFEKTEMPFKIGLDDFKKYQKATTEVLKSKVKKPKSNLDTKLLQKYLNNGNKNMMLSRMGPPIQMPVARFSPNDQTVAVVYASYRSYRIEKDISFQLALFDLKGNNITSIGTGNLLARYNFNLANTSAYGGSTTCTIQADGYIWQRNYKAIWEKDEKEFGIQDNTIIDYELVDTNVFQIRADGNIAEAKNYPVRDRASL